MQHSPDSGPDVITFPPVIVGVGLGLSLLARKIIRVPLAPDGLTAPRKLTGIALIAAGTALAGWSAGTMLKAGTNVSPHQPATALVEEGPFRYTRNPIYVGGSAVYCGITLLLNNFWGIVLFPVITAVLQRGVIEREEEYLHTLFGEEYAAYTERVPRWL